MTSYILREPAYHKSAKLAAKLARADNLGYASDIRLQSAYEKQTYNQLAAPSTVTTMTQTELTDNLAPTQMLARPQIPESTVGVREIPISAPIVGATSQTPSIVRSVPSSATSSVIEELKGKLSARAAEQVAVSKGTQWPIEIMDRLKNIARVAKGKRIDLNKGGRGGLKPLYSTMPENKKIEGVSLWLDTTNEDKPVLRYSIKNGDTGILTPDVKKFGIEKGNIDINRAIDEFSSVKRRNNVFEGVGLKSRKSIRKNISLHWEDRIMAGDANYVLRNPFLSGRISYYPYGAHMNQILIRQPSKHALNIVRDLVENHTFKQSDYDMLQKEEGDKINQIIKLSQVPIPHDVRMKGYHLDDIAELKQRYKVLVGEITAGNHGKLVLEEMRDIVKQLAKYRAISEPTKRKMLGQINSVK